MDLPWTNTSRIGVPGFLNKVATCIPRRPSIIARILVEEVIPFFGVPKAFLSNWEQISPHTWWTMWVNSWGPQNLTQFWIIICPGQLFMCAACCRLHWPEPKFRYTCLWYTHLVTQYLGVGEKRSYICISTVVATLFKYEVTTKKKIPIIAQVRTWISNLVQG